MKLEEKYPPPHLLTVHPCDCLQQLQPVQFQVVVSVVFPKFEKLKIEFLGQIIVCLSVSHDLIRNEISNRQVKYVLCLCDHDVIFLAIITFETSFVTNNQPNQFELKHS